MKLKENFITPILCFLLFSTNFWPSHRLLGISLILGLVSEQSYVSGLVRTQDHFVRLVECVNCVHKRPNLVKGMSCLKYLYKILEYTLYTCLFLPLMFETGVADATLASLSWQMKQNSQNSVCDLWVVMVKMLPAILSIVVCEWQLLTRSLQVLFFHHAI